MTRLLFSAAVGYAVALLVVRRHIRQAAAELREDWNEVGRQADARHGMDDDDWLGEWPPNRPIVLPTWTINGPLTSNDTSTEVH